MSKNNPFIDQQKCDVLIECIVSILLRTNRLTQVNRCISGATQLSNSIIAFLIKGVEVYFDKNPVMLRHDSPKIQLSMPLKPSLIGINL